MPDLIYTVEANYDFNDLVTLGINTTGQSSVIDDAGRQYPGGAVFGLNVRVMPIENLELGIQGYNIFNRYDLRGSGGVAVAGSPYVIGTGPALGRTWTASVKYNF